MSKLISNVLLKIVRGGSNDRVLFIDNIPEELFYKMEHPKKIAGENGSQHWVSDADKDKIPTLHEEIKLSQTGDGGLVFNMQNINAQERYATIERYISANYPSNKTVPKPKPNCIDPSDLRSSALALSDVPRVVLSALSPSVDATDAGSTTASLIKPADVNIEAIKKQAVEEYEAAKKVAAKERMAKARAARQASK